MENSILQELKEMEERLNGRFDKIDERLEDSQKSEVMKLQKNILKKQEEMEIDTGYLAQRVEELARKVYKIERKLKDQV
ncbi:hypothetical protein [Bacillus sp. V59.32b]|uniref:hypothetical protein n=1 Tax=Bacillus sp. V59.32b TaxID=1758642 RepID=UPI000E3C224D|nr:hypothetical protein [Bacillus sp. V59.32b]RFU60997.1 hypothetical protein D0463_15690 [Bacillus sp. V59.32b]